MSANTNLSATTTISNFSLIVDKKGYPSLILTATEQPVPSFAVGQSVDVNGTVDHLSGVVESVSINIDVTRTPTGEVRMHTTRVVLA